MATRMNRGGAFYHDKEKTLVKSGTLRGRPYEIYSYVGGRSLSGPILHYYVRVQYGDGDWSTSQAPTLQGAMTKLDRDSRWAWRHENEYEKSLARGDRGLTENPLSSPEKIGVGVALAAGVAAAIYYWTRPATTT